MPRVLILIFTGIMAGILISVQSLINTAMGNKIGNFGSVLVVALVNVVAVLILILLFPKTADFRQLPGIKEWYLYSGGVIGTFILAAIIFLMPRAGASLTITSLVVGQIVFGLIIDQFGLFNLPKLEINLPRIIGVLLLIAGVYLIKK